MKKEFDEETEPTTTTTTTTAAANEKAAAEDAKIHTTNGEEAEEDYACDERGNLPRKNLVTGIPESEFEHEGKTVVRRKSPKALIALTVFVVIGIFSIAMFFIFKGKSDYKEVANVKDNSLKTGINSNSSMEDADFGGDYAKRYGDNANNAGNMNANTNANTMPAYGTVGNNVTAAPPLGNQTGGIYQPGQMQPVPPPQPNQSGNNLSGGGSNSSGGGGGGGFSPNGNPKPEVVAPGTINPDKSTDVLELPENQTRETGGLNNQVSLYFYDRPGNRADGGRVQKIELESRVAARPDFGTVLPVKVLGRLHTLGTGGLARMELTRAVQGTWGTLPRGTMFVGRVSGGMGNRLFVSLLGYIDSDSNRLVTLGGDLQGRDGALGVEGDVKRVGSRWKAVFGELFGAAKEIGSAYLLGRRGSGTVINNGQLTDMTKSLDDKNAAKFVLVPAGSRGYIVINDLPPATDSDERLGANTKELTDEEILKMIQAESPADVERIIPGLSPRGQQIARGAVGK